MTTSIAMSAGLCNDDEHVQDKDEFNLSKAVEEFEGNLRRAFNNEGERLRRLTKEDHCINIEDVAFSKDDIYVLLTRPLTKHPDFRLKHLKFNIKSATIKMVISLGNVTVSCGMRTVAKSMFASSRTTSLNHLNVSLNGLTIEAKLGLTRSEDNFRIKNVHLEYAEGLCSATEFRGKSEAERTEFAALDDFTPASLILPDLISEFDELLKLQLKVVEEFSLSESLLAEIPDQIDDWDSIWRQTTTRVNFLADNFLNRLHMHGINDSLPTEFQLPYRENLFARVLRADGKIEGLSTLGRHQDWATVPLERDNLCFGCFKLKKLRFVYDFSTSYGSESMYGNINAKIHQCLLSVSFCCDEQTGNVSNVKIQRIFVSDVDYEFYHLGCLTRLSNDLRTLIKGHISVEMQNKVRHFLQTSFNSFSQQNPT